MKLKIGIISSLNARPLTWGFENNPDYEIVSATPAVLKEKLIRKELDTALISSVECFRNPELGYYTTTGVCSKEEVKSILFFKNKKEMFPPTRIWVDSGSRSSVALLKVLFQMEFSHSVQTESLAPEKIMEQIVQGKGHHMLFGDNALEVKWNSDDFEIVDLSGWWFRLTKLPFVFAFWAFPIGLHLDETIFTWSLQYGLDHIEDIIEKETRFPESFTRKYLTHDLHYKTTEEDLKGFQLFKEKCLAFGLV